MPCINLIPIDDKSDFVLMGCKLIFIFIAFKNFENKMKDIDFEYNQKTKCKDWNENYDLSDM